MRPFDIAGLALGVLLAAWTLSGDGRPGPVVALLAGMVAAVIAGRVLVARGLPAFAVVAVGVGGALAITWPGMLQVTGPPTGYANANATLTGLGVVAAIGAARQAQSRAVNRWSLALAVVLLAALPFTGSVAGTVVVVVAVVLIVVALATRWPAAAVGGGLVLCAIALGGTVAIAAGGDLFGLDERAGVRAELWAGAEALADEEPWRGIGAGEFAARNPVTDDPDLRWAHHGALQVAAELGIVGLLLALAVVGWMWVALLRAARTAPGAATVGAGALCAVGLHSTFDHVLHVPAVVLVAMWIFGIATAG